MATIQLRGSGKNIQFNGNATPANADVLVSNTGEYSGKKLFWLISGTGGGAIQVSADNVNWIASGVVMPATPTSVPTVLDGPYPYIRVVATCVGRISS